jgi:hypothetical protein
MVTNGCGNLVVEDGLQPRSQISQVLSSELLEAAMRFQESLLNDVGGVNSHRDPSLELPLGQAVESRPLGIQ